MIGSAKNFLDRNPCSDFTTLTGSLSKEIYAKIKTNRRKINFLAVSSIPPVWNTKLTSHWVHWSFLECDVVDKCEPAIWCHAFCSSRFKCAHLEAVDVNTLDPVHGRVVDEISSVVEVIDGCLDVNQSTAGLEANVLERNGSALHIGRL